MQTEGEVNEIMQSKRNKTHWRGKHMRKVDGLPWQMELRETTHSPEAVSITQDPEESAFPGQTEKQIWWGRKLFDTLWTLTIYFLGYREI